MILYRRIPTYKIIRIKYSNLNNLNLESINHKGYKQYLKSPYDDFSNDKNHHIDLQQKKSRFDKFLKKETHKTALIVYFDFKVLSFTRMIIGKIIGLRCVF